MLGLLLHACGELLIPRLEASTVELHAVHARVDVVTPTAADPCAAWQRGWLRHGIQWLVVFRLLCSQLGGCSLKCSQLARCEVSQCYVHVVVVVESVPVLLCDYPAGDESDQGTMQPRRNTKVLSYLFEKLVDLERIASSQRGLAFRLIPCAVVDVG
jgi:hypothetical protein